LSESEAPLGLWCFVFEAPEWIGAPDGRADDPNAENFINRKATASTFTFCLLL
jgi:hypothetical protein